MTTRVENWDTQLVRFAQALAGQPFEWGRTDCGSVVRGGLTQVLGHDPWRKHLGVWSTKVGAIRVLKRTRPSVTLEASGAVRVGTLYATAGDVAVGRAQDHGGMLQLGLVLPTRKMLTSSPERGVYIAAVARFVSSTRFWRYG